MVKAGMVNLQSRAIMVQLQQRTFDAGRPASATIQPAIKLRHSSFPRQMMLNRMNFCFN
jgi:hypothetical protein